MFALLLNQLRKMMVLAIVWLTTHNQQFKLGVKKFLLALKRSLEAESDETRHMIQIYLKSSHGKASKEEINMAHKQFKELIKSLGLGALLILPLAPLTLPLVVSLGKKLGVEVMPNFIKNFDKTNS